MLGELRLYLYQSEILKVFSYFIKILKGGIYNLKINAILQ